MISQIKLKKLKKVPGLRATIYSLMIPAISCYLCVGCKTSNSSSTVKNENYIPKPESANWLDDIKQGCRPGSFKTSWKEGDFYEILKGQLSTEQLSPETLRKSIDTFRNQYKVSDYRRVLEHQEAYLSDKTNRKDAEEHASIILALLQSHDLSTNPQNKAISSLEPHTRTDFQRQLRFALALNFNLAYTVKALRDLEFVAQTSRRGLGAVETLLREYEFAKGFSYLEKASSSDEVDPLTKLSRGFVWQQSTSFEEIQKFESRWAELNNRLESKEGLWSKLKNFKSSTIPTLDETLAIPNGAYEYRILTYLQNRFLEDCYGSSSAAAPYPLKVFRSTSVNLFLNTKKDSSKPGDIGSVLGSALSTTTDSKEKVPLLPSRQYISYLSLIFAPKVSKLLFYGKDSY